MTAKYHGKPDLKSERRTFVRSGRSGIARAITVALWSIWGILLPSWLVLAHAGSDGDSVAHEMKMMDSNGDGKISADEHASGARRMFAMMDGNGDGKVTASEMDAAHDKVTGHGATRLKDKVGALAEKKGAAAAPAASELSAADKIKALDKNGDGVLTAEEHEAGAKMMFGKMDTDQDGALTKSEVAAGHAKMLRKMAK